MSSDYRSQPLFREGEKTPSTTGKLTPGTAPVVRQVSDAATSSVASSRLPPRRFSQRNSVASSAIITPVPAVGTAGAARQGVVVSATTPVAQDKDGDETWVIFSGQSSSCAAESVDKRRSRGPAASRAAHGPPIPTAAPLPAVAEDAAVESLGEPALSVSAGTGDWIDSLDEDEAPGKDDSSSAAVVVVAASEKSGKSQKSQKSERSTQSSATPVATAAVEAPVLYGTVEGRARRASSCSEPSSSSAPSSKSPQPSDASPPPRPVHAARNNGARGGGGGVVIGSEGFAPPLSVAALGGGGGGGGRQPVTRMTGAASATPRSSKAASSTPRQSVGSHGSAVRPFDLRTSSPQRGSVVRHQSELLRMELEKPMHRVPAAEMGRLMALPRGNDSALPTGMTRLDLAQEEDVKELFRQQYLVDPLMRKRPGKKQFYVPPQADIFGMYGIRDLPLEEEEERAWQEANREAGGVATGSASVVSGDNRPVWEHPSTGGEDRSEVASGYSMPPSASASQRSAPASQRPSERPVSERPSQRPASDRPSTRGEEDRSDVAPEYSMPASASASVSQRSAPVSHISKASAPTSPPPQPRATSRIELLERCAQRRQQREQQQQQQQRQQQPQQTRQPVLARPPTAVLSQVSGYSGFAQGSSTARSVGAQAQSEVSAASTGRSQPRAAPQLPSPVPASSDMYVDTEGEEGVEVLLYGEDKSGSADYMVASSREPGRLSEAGAAASSSLHRASRPPHGSSRGQSRSTALPPTPSRVMAIATAVVAETHYAPGGVPSYTLNGTAQTVSEDAYDDSAAYDDSVSAVSSERPRPTPGRRGRPSIQPTAEKTNLDLSWQPTEEAEVSHNVDSGADYHPSVRQRDAIARQYAEQPDNVHQRARPESRRFTAEMAAQGAHGDHDIFGVSARVGQLAMDAAMRQYNEQQQEQKRQLQQLVQQPQQGPQSISEASSMSGRLPVAAPPHAQVAQRPRQQQQRHYADPSLSGSSSPYMTRAEEPRPYPNRGRRNNSNSNASGHERRLSSEVGEEAVMRSLNDGRRPFMTGEVESFNEDAFVPARAEVGGGSESFTPDDAPLDDAVGDAEYDLDAYMDQRLADGASHSSRSTHHSSIPPHAQAPRVNVPAPLPEAPPHYLPYSAAPYAPVRNTPRAGSVNNNNNNNNNRSAVNAPSCGSVGNLSPIPRASTTDPATQLSSRGDETSFIIRRTGRAASESHTCDFCGHDVVLPPGQSVPPVMVVVSGPAEVEVLPMSDGVPSRQISPEPTVTHRGRLASRPSVPVEETGPAYMCKPRDHDIFLRHPATAADAPTPTGRRSFSAGAGNKRRVSQVYDSSQVSGVFRWKN